MDWPILAPFLAATLLLLLTPGPVLAMVAHNTLRGGAAVGIRTALGVATGEILVLGAVFLGLILSQEFLPLLFRCISLAGIAYLAWLAIAIVLSPRRKGPSATVTGCSRPALEGLTIALSNPATFIFYTAFFPQFVIPHQALFPQLVTLGSVYLVACILFDLIIIVAVTRLRSSTGNGCFRFRRLAELGSAALYLSIAAFALFGLAAVPA